MIGSDPAGGYGDWISNLTEDAVQHHLYCYECKTHISGTYWYINEEVLCDDCARWKYQRGINELGDYEGL